MPQIETKDTHRLRALITEAAKTVARDGGDEWLARELRRESCRLGEGLLDKLWEEHHYISYGELAILIAHDYMVCRDYDIAEKTLADACAILADYEDTENSDTEAHNLLAELETKQQIAHYHSCGRSARRRSALKREIRRERMMMWRNSLSKRILRRVYFARSLNRPKRSHRWYTIHRRINERAAKQIAERAASDRASQQRGI